MFCRIPRPTGIARGTGSRSAKQTKSLLRKCRSLQSISTILQEQSGGLDVTDDAARPLLLTMAVQVLVLAQARAQPLLRHGASHTADDHEHVRTMRTFMEAHLPAWLAASPPPLHLVAALHALLLLDGGGGAAGRQGPLNAVSARVKTALKALVSVPDYLKRASRRVVFKQSAATPTQESPASLQADMELLQGPGGQLPALVAVLCELGLGRCLGEGLYHMRLGKLLWSQGVDARGRLLKAHALGLCHSFGVAESLGGRGGSDGAVLSVASSGGRPETARQQPGPLNVFDDGFDPGDSWFDLAHFSWVSPDAADKEEEEEEEKKEQEKSEEVEEGGQPQDEESWQEAASDPELDARIRAKSIFLLDLDFLNQRLPEELRIELLLLTPEECGRRVDALAQSKTAAWALRESQVAEVAALSGFDKVKALSAAVRFNSVVLKSIPGQKAEEDGEDAGEEELGPDSDEGDSDSEAVDGSALSSAWQELAFQAVLDGAAACASLNQLEETLLVFAPLLALAGEGEAGGQRYDRCVLAVTEALFRIDGGQHNDGSSTEPGGTVCTASSSTLPVGFSGPVHDDGSLLLPAHLLAFLLDHFPPGLHALEPPLLQHLLLLLHQRGCMPALLQGEGTRLSRAILGRVMAPDFLVWLDDVADEDHERVAQALRAMGFSMCSRRPSVGGHETVSPLPLIGAAAAAVKLLPAVASSVASVGQPDSLPVPNNPEAASSAGQESLPACPPSIEGGPAFPPALPQATAESSEASQREISTPASVDTGYPPETAFPQAGSQHTMPPPRGEPGSPTACGAGDGGSGTASQHTEPLQGEPGSPRTSEAATVGFKEGSQHTARLGGSVGSKMASAASGTSEPPKVDPSAVGGMPQQSEFIASPVADSRQAAACPSDGSPSPPPCTASSSDCVPCIPDTSSDRDSSSGQGGRTSEDANADEPLGLLETPVVPPAAGLLPLPEADSSPLSELLLKLFGPDNGQQDISEKNDDAGKTQGGDFELGLRSACSLMGISCPKWVDDLDWLRDPAADTKALQLQASSLPDLRSAERLALEADSAVQELRSLLGDMAEAGPKKVSGLPLSTMIEHMTTMQQISRLLQDYWRLCVKTGNSRGGAVLSVALERILKGDEGFRLAGQDARSLFDLLAAWRPRLTYLVPPSLCHLIVSTFGSQELLKALAVQLASAATTRQQRRLGGGGTTLTSDGVTSIRLAVEILRGSSFGSAEKSQWLLHLAKTSKTFSVRGLNLNGKTVMEDAMCDLAASQFDSGGSASGVMQQLLKDVDGGEAASAVISASAIVLHSAWDPELARAILACLQRAAAGLWFVDLADVCNSCLQSFWLNDAETSQLLQLLRLPCLAAAVKAKQVGPPSMVSHILGTRAQSELEQNPAAALELLRLSSSYGFGLEMGTCEEVLSRCIATKQMDMVVAAISLFFKTTDFATAVPSVSALRGLVSLPAAQPAAFMLLCDPARHCSFSSLLLRIGAAEASPSWALAAAREAAERDISVPPDVVSELAEAFMPPHVQHSEFVAAEDSCGVGDGVSATILAFTLMLEAQNTPTGPYRSPAEPDASEPRGFGSSGMQGSARLKPDRSKQQAVAVVKGRKGGWRGLTPIARSRIARHLLLTADPELLRFRPLALSMAPSREAAAQLLTYQPTPTGNVFPSGFISKVLELASDKANEAWRDLGAPALSALRQLPRDQRVSELAGGGALALCQLLIRDAVPPTVPSPPDGPASLHLLLECLTEFSSGVIDNSGAAPPPAQLLSPPEWRDLVLQLLDLGDELQWDRASPLLAQVMQVLGLAAEAGGPGKWLPEKVWILQQALIGGPQRTARQPSVLLVARTMLEDLQGHNWTLPPGGNDGEAAASNADPSPSSAAAPATASSSFADGSRAIDDIVKVYSGLLTWCLNQKAIIADIGSAGSDEGFRSWLLPLLAQLCESLSASPHVGAKWATRLLCGEAGTVFLCKLCCRRGLDRPVVDLLRAHLRDSKKVSRDLVRVALPSVSELEAWELGEPLLLALGIGPDAWGSGKAMLDLTLRSLDPDQARAVLLLLFHHCETAGVQWSPAGMARAMLTAAALVPSHFPSTPESLALDLSMRSLGADAASEAFTDAQERKPSEKPEAYLDPAHHAAQAEEAVRKLVIDPFQQMEMGSSSQGTASESAATRRQPPPAPPPSPELYAQLMDVFDAAGLPLRAADLALRVLTTELPICASSGHGADGGAETAADTLPVAVLAVVADAMRVSNEASLYRVSALLFREALLRGGGEISHAGLVEQVLEAVEDSESSLDAYVEASVDAAVNGGYFALSDAQDRDSWVKADEAWVRAAQQSRGGAQWRAALSEIEAHYEAKEVAAAASEVSAYFSAPTPRAAPDSEVATGFEGSEYGGEVVALFGGKEFKASDRQWLLRISPPGSRVVWFGSPRDTGTGSIVRLVQAIKSGGITRVYIQTRHNGHVQVAMVKEACSGYDVPYDLLSVGMKSRLKAEGLEGQMRRRDRTPVAGE